MMIVDADTHVSPTSEGGNSISAEELLRRMDRAGVEKALTWLQPPYLREVALSNRYVYEAAKSHPDRIIGYGWVDPNLGRATALDTVRRCIGEYGFPGVKLNGAQNNFRIDDPELALPIVEAVAGMGRSIAFHIGADAYNNTHPYRLQKVAAMFPELTILAVHMGGASFEDMSSIVIEVAESNPNIHLIGSAVRSIPILTAIRKLGASRVSFGSDTPFELMHVEVARYRALLEGEISKADVEKVMGENILRVLGAAPRKVS